MLGLCFLHLAILRPIASRGLWRACFIGDRALLFLYPLLFHFLFFLGRIPLRQMVMCASYTLAFYVVTIFFSSPIDWPFHFCIILSFEMYIVIGTSDRVSSASGLIFLGG